MDTKLYHENLAMVSRTAAIALFILVIGILAFSLYSARADGEIEYGSTEGMIIVACTALVLVLMAFTFMMRMKITVTYESLSVGYFKGRVIPMYEITDVSMEEFNAIKDYGGWGVRIGRKGVGYIAGGTNKGLRIHLMTGKSFMVSSKNPYDFENAMRMALRNKKK